MKSHRRCCAALDHLEGVWLRPGHADLELHSRQLDAYLIAYTMA